MTVICANCKTTYTGELCLTRVGAGGSAHYRCPNCEREQTVTLNGQEFDAAVARAKATVRPAGRRGGGRGE